MRPIIRLGSALALILAAGALWAQPAVANTKVTNVVHVNDTFVDSETCGVDITVHVVGSFKSSDYFDNNGSIIKTIITVGPGGPFTITETANGTTLTMQNQSYQVMITYNSDGSPRSLTLDGPVMKFTVPGSGAVLLEVGRVTFDSEGNLLFEAGPHQQLDGDVGAFCAAFG